MLALGRALMADPRVLLMDEPSLGLAPVLVQEIFALIGSIHRQGKTLLLIEQNARAALSICDYAYVIETGRIAMEGTGDELLDNDDVRKIYLGEVAGADRCCAGAGSASAQHQVGVAPFRQAYLCPPEQIGVVTTVIGCGHRYLCDDGVGPSMATGIAMML